MSGETDRCSLRKRETGAQMEIRDNCREESEIGGKGSKNKYEGKKIEISGLMVYKRQEWDRKISSDIAQFFAYNIL